MQRQPHAVINLYAALYMSVIRFYSNTSLLCFLLYQVGLWIFGGMLNVDAVTAAILGLSVLLVTGVVTWKECLAESVAWDTLTWFAALIAMAGYLNKYGLISWFSQSVVKVCLSFSYWYLLVCPFSQSCKDRLLTLKRLKFYCSWLIYNY